MLRVVAECHILHAAPAGHGLGSTHQAGQGQLSELARHPVAQNATLPSSFRFHSFVGS